MNKKSKVFQQTEVQDTVTDKLHNTFEEWKHNPSQFFQK